ncbi:hypothetical protein FRUB_01738 [Fimbriiglobus ruber]|uniref:Uncharacterized protein n=1 Tax=Fimbriiglobus ruber TaxID=1908690 RepID=A0A225EAH4_9BACT|nr:hypothetical protein FRUB_01738 [Fimbriiglobus ruber]
MIAFALAVVGGGAYLLAVWYDRPAFTIDPTQPFQLEFGRGSGGRRGLDTVKIDQTGRAVLHRMKSERKEGVSVLSWEFATLQLSPEALAEVLKAVESNGLMGLRNAYHEDIYDGTQWVLWIKQGDREKSVYFDNNFPQQIEVFAEQLDDILARAGVGKVSWQPVPERQSRQHERELWDSIKR